MLFEISLKQISDRFSLYRLVFVDLVNCRNISRKCMPNVSSSPKTCTAESFFSLLGELNPARIINVRWWSLRYILLNRIYICIESVRQNLLISFYILGTHIRLNRWNLIMQTSASQMHLLFLSSFYCMNRSDRKNERRCTIF